MAAPQTIVDELENRNGYGVSFGANAKNLLVNENGSNRNEATTERFFDKLRMTRETHTSYTFLLVFKLARCINRPFSSSTRNTFRMDGERRISAILRFRRPGGAAAQAKTAFFPFIEDLSLR